MLTMCVFVMTPRGLRCKTSKATFEKRNQINQHEIQKNADVYESQSVSFAAVEDKIFF